MKTQRASRRSDNWVTFGLGGLAIVLLGLTQGIPMLVTFGVIKPLNVKLSDQVILSMALYAYLIPAIGIWLYARIARHHDVRWFSGWNIFMVMAVYAVTAYVADSLGHPAMSRAALWPLFWIATHWLAIAAVLLALIGFTAVTWAFRHKSHINPETMEVPK
ncbi:hypothetical protein PV379_00745 [Streptomyces caniscabiei]|uniref:hypothetical protein n=1 Tax=Streptomyces caniscabiei TaxID=2746961 RepID=UPI0029BAB7B9|nr:hypothetical protein [Streptomyces caniscabiei]MDX2775884.1 hypothetical protein [Streptomyces caniscabiei]